MNITYNAMLEDMKMVEETGFGLIIAPDFSSISQFIIVVVAPISIVMIMAATVNSFGFYNKRMMTDTLGCLPVSYRERFWGDFLSGASTNFISFVPFFIVSLILTENLKNPKFAILNGFSVSDYLLIPRLLRGLWFTLLFVYLGVYAVTAFVTSCCGKKSSAVLYSFIAMAALPGIYFVYGNSMFSLVLGMDAFYEVMKNICMLPPLGPVISIIMGSIYRGDLPIDPKYCMLNENPFYLVIFLILTAAFIAGAYFIGKRRRAENVGESFVFKIAYHVLTLIFMVLLIGASYVGYSNIMDNSGIQWVLLFTFIVYAALEILQNKGFKGFWKAAVRYAAVFGVFIGFFAIVNNTNAFNMYKMLPSAGSVKEVRVSGKYFYNPYRLIYNENKEYVLDTKESVSVILNEHKSLLDNDSIYTGKELRIVYVLKNGQEIMRQYSYNTELDDRIRSFCDAAKDLPDFDFGDLGVIDDPELDKYTVYFTKPHTSRRYVREDKLEEFAEILRNDIKYNYSSTGRNQETYGKLFIIEKNKQHDWDNDYYIYPTYAATIEFLENPDNYTTEEVKFDVDKYLFYYNTHNLSVRVEVSTGDKSAAAKELLSYIKPISEDISNDQPKSVSVKSVYTDISYTIDPTNKEAAINAMIELFLERH